jgi:hypothetical protein
MLGHKDNKSQGLPIKVTANDGSSTQGLDEMKMKELREKADREMIRQWRFKKTKMRTSGQLTRTYIQLHADFKVQLEPYDI